MPRSIAFSTIDHNTKEGRLKLIKNMYGVYCAFTLGPRNPLNFAAYVTRQLSDTLGLELKLRYEVEAKQWLTKYNFLNN